MSPAEEKSPVILEPKEEEPTEGRAYVRWQSTMRQHLGATINLILTLTVAALGFAISLFIPKEGGSFHLAQSAAPLVVVSLAVLIIAALFGLLVNLTRLSDFRWTARAARLREIRSGYRKSPTKSPRPVLPKWAGRLERRLENQSFLQKAWRWRDRRKDAAGATSGTSNDEETLTGDALDDRLTTLLKDVRDKHDAFGRTTWLLFPCQLAAFFIGIAFLILGMWYQIRQPPREADALKNLTERVNKVEGTLARESDQVKTLTTEYIQINGRISKTVDRTRKVSPGRRRATRK